MCEVQAWRQVRGPAVTVMCETRDLGIKWPHCHLDFRRATGGEHESGLLVLEGNQKPDAREMKNMGTKSKDMPPELQMLSLERESVALSPIHVHTLGKTGTIPK